MKYRLEGTTIEAIDTYVRITLGNGRVEVSDRQCPTGEQVAEMLNRMQGYWPNQAQRINCALAARDAENNKIELAL